MREMAGEMSTPMQNAGRHADSEMRTAGMHVLRLLSALTLVSSALTRRVWDAEPVLAVPVADHDLAAGYDVADLPRVHCAAVGVVGALARVRVVVSEQLALIKELRVGKGAKAGRGVTG